jgi:hypothetical protein
MCTTAIVKVSAVLHLSGGMKAPRTSSSGCLAVTSGGKDAHTHRLCMLGMALHSGGSVPSSWLFPSLLQASMLIVTCSCALDRSHFAGCRSCMCILAKYLYLGESNLLPGAHMTINTVRPAVVCS